MIDVYPDTEALSRAAAALFVAQAQQAVAVRGRFSVLLAGGETPRRTYELLAGEPWRSRVTWSKVHVFWGDERCVADDSPYSNARMARAALLDRVPLPAGQIHPIVCHSTPEAAATAYAAALQTFFGTQPPRFDLVFLGLGDDGHTASLLPGSTALAEEHRWTAVTRRADEPFSRITLTPLLLNQAALVVFLVAGRSKAAILRTLYCEPPAAPLPAQLIRPLTGEVRWLVDRAAAALLPTSLFDHNAGHAS